MPDPLPTRITLEVAVETVEDAVAAEAGGADRLELCAALDLGGLTPSLGAYLEVRAATGLPVVVMIRPRPGDFVYADGEARVMARDVDQFLPHRPDGFVFGMLRPDALIDTERLHPLRQRCGDVPCVFHRAFDRARVPEAALDDVVRLGFRRVLTSGREADALAGSANIAELVRHAAGRIEILPGGRVRAKNIETVVRVTGCDQVHGSFAEPVAAPEGKGHRGYPPHSRTSRDEVAAARAVLDRLM